MLRNLHHLSHEAGRQTVRQETSDRSHHLIHRSFGYVLYVSTLVLSVMMLGFTLLGSHFIQTKNVTQTGHELKLTTGFTAEACMEMALEKIGLDNDYAGNEVLNVDGFTCRIRPVYKLDNQWIMEVEAQNGSNFYRYRVKLSNLDPMTVSSWLEVPQF